MRQRPCAQKNSTKVSPGNANSSLSLGLTSGPREASEFHRLKHSLRVPSPGLQSFLHPLGVVLRRERRRAPVPRSVAVEARRRDVPRQVFPTLRPGVEVLGCGEQAFAARRGRRQKHRQAAVAAAAGLGVESAVTEFGQGRHGEGSKERRPRRAYKATNGHRRPRGHVGTTTALIATVVTSFARSAWSLQAVRNRDQTRDKRFRDTELLLVTN